MRCHPRLNSVIYPWCRDPFVRGAGTSTPPKKAETRTCPTPVSSNLTDSVIHESYFHFLQLSQASKKKQHLSVNWKTLGEVCIRRGIVQGDTFFLTVRLSVLSIWSKLLPWKYHLIPESLTIHVLLLHFI